MPRRENKTTAKVIDGVLYHETGSFSVESSEWWTWLKRGETFYVETNAGTFTARCEERPVIVGGPYWYAYRRRVKLYKLYLGKSEELTKVHLAEAAQLLADRADSNGATNA